MMDKEIPLAFDSYKHSSLPISAQRLVNMYAEVQSRSAKSKAVVHGCPGITPWLTVGQGPIRGFIVMAELLYVVSGQELWTVARDGTLTLKGSGIAGIDRVSLAENGFEIVIVNGANVFSYLAADTTFVQVGSPGAYASDTVTVMNSVFVLEKKGTNQFYISEVLDGRTYDVADFASAESKSDNVLGVTEYNGLLYAFGTNSIELNDYTGAAAFPFSAIKGGVISRGIASSRAFASEDKSLFILGEDRVAYRVFGTQHMRISTTAIEKEWETYSIVSDCFAFVVLFAGHKFIYFTFPTANKTWCYDIASGLWHERSSYDGTANENKWRVQVAINTYDAIIAGDSTSGLIGTIEEDVWTEFGQIMIAEMVTPPVYEGGKMISAAGVEIDIDAGHGTTIGQGSNPIIRMSPSKDKGHNFLSERESTLGRKGNYIARARWTGLGSAYQWSFRLRISDPVRRTMTAARLLDYYAE
jgi:hypothetical protein